jgi:hypothetical protein
MKNRILQKLAVQFGITSAMILTSVSVHAESFESVTAFENLTSLESDDLGGTRGRSGETVITVQSNQNLEANITGSTFSVDTINSGGVTFSEGALENFGGVGLFNVVTGNNNAVNSSVGVTVNLK